MFSSHSNDIVGHKALEEWQSHLIPLPSQHGGDESYFPDVAPCNDMVYSELVVGIQPGDSGVVIGYQVD